MRGRFANVIHAVYCEPWLIRPEMHATISQIVEAHVTGAAHEVDGLAIGLDLDGNQEDVFRVTDDGVGIINVSGVIGKRVSALEKTSGVTDVDEIGEALDAAVGDDAVRGLVLDINSPGGTVTGVPELAEKIRQARDVKPVVAYSDTQACSAAYWLMSQAWATMAAPSALVGSVGVYLAVLDASRRYEMEGLHQDVIKAGRFKGAGIPGTQLTDDQRANLQAQVTHIHERFKEAVRTGRETGISDEWMEGQEMYADQAAEAKLIDGIGTLADAVEMAGSRGGRNDA